MAETGMIGGEFILPGAGSVVEPKLPEPKTPEEAADLPEGSEYLRDGKKYTIPFRPKTPEEAESLPEGALYVTPDGKQMRAPKYEGLDFTTQTLYNMAANDRERKRALERGYPGKVKESASGYYVDDGGTLRRSKGFTQSPGAFAASQAAPVLSSIAGEVIGGTLGGAGGATAGSVVPGPGTVAGGVAGLGVGTVTGGAAGGAVGQAFNDSILALAGVYDRGAGEEAGELGLAAMFGGGGTILGGTGAAIAPAAKGAIKNVLPKAVAGFLGETPEGAAQASALREKGVLVPPSAHMKEAPHIINIAERFDPAFRTQDPLLQSATEHYERAGKDILGQLGADTAKVKLTDPEAAVSTERAGEAVLGRTREELRKADEELRAALEARRTELTGQAAERSAAKESQTKALEVTAQDARDAAQKVIDAGFNEIDASSRAAMDAVKAGHNSGSLWQQVAEKIQKVRAGIMARANKMYSEADSLAGDLKPDIGGLPERAQAFLDQLPEGFEGRYPAIVKQLRDMAGKRATDKEGNIVEGWEREPVEPTWAQLHNLRSVMRQNYNRFDLTPDVKQGTFKFFANRVDEILNDANAVPELQAAAKQLREADNFYRENMGAFNDKRIQAVMDGLDAGLPADPKVLFDTIVKEGRSDLTAKVANMVGPNLWAGVKAADIQEMLAQSRSLTGQIDGRRFVSQVLDRYRSGMLEAVHGKEVTAKLLEQAQNIEALAGRLNIPARPGDTLRDIITRAKGAADAAKAAAKQDPLGTLTKEVRGIESKLANTKHLARKHLKTNNALDFLYDESVGASEAVDKILGSEDLIIAAASKFGPDSSEFNLLRQTWAQRLLTGTLTPSSKLAKVSEEVQRIMFPGVSLDQMRTLAKEMDFLMGTRGSLGTSMAGGLAAMSKVEHPWSSIPLGKAAGKLIPGFDAAGRWMLGKYFKFVTDLANNPAFITWITKGLKGDEQARQLVRETVQQRMKVGGAIGAGAGQALFQAPNQNVMFNQ